MNNKSGMTMVELLIYITIFSVVILLFGKQLKILINQYTAGKSTAKQQLDARNTISTLLGEIQNTGLKVYRTTGGPVIAPGIMHSFVHKQGIPSDTLTICKIELDNTGNWTNRIDTIRYYLNGTALTREYQATGIAKSSGIIAENVYALQFLYGTNVANTLLLNQITLTSASWPTFTNLFGTAPTKTTGTNNIKLEFSGIARGFIQYQPSFSVVANQKYLINTIIIPSGNFPKNLDSLCFSFRKTSDNTVIAYEKFLPQKTGNQFIVPIQSSQTVYATIDYCAKGSGTLNIKGVEATCIESGTYTWMNNPTTVIDKQNVRVIRIQMLTRSDNNTGVKTGGSLVVGDATISTSDNYTWRLFDDVIEVPNNGNPSIASGIPAGTTLIDSRIRTTLISVQF